MAESTKFTVHLSPEELDTLVLILNHVGGSPETSLRKHAKNISRVLYPFSRINHLESDRVEKLLPYESNIQFLPESEEEYNKILNKPERVTSDKLKFEL